jgi:hypothetical protein
VQAIARIANQYQIPDFIARLAALVPPPRVHLTRYHGVGEDDVSCLNVLERVASVARMSDRGRDR